jgi:hypothetical protein
VPQELTIGTYAEDTHDALRFVHDLEPDYDLEEEPSPGSDKGSSDKGSDPEVRLTGDLSRSSSSFKHGVVQVQSPERAFRSGTHRTRQMAATRTSRWISNTHHQLLEPLSRPLTRLDLDPVSTRFVTAVICVVSGSPLPVEAVLLEPSTEFIDAVIQVFSVSISGFTVVLG